MPNTLRLVMVAFVAFVTCFLGACASSRKPVGTLADWDKQMQASAPVAAEPVPGTPTVTATPTEPEQTTEGEDPMTPREPVPVVTLAQTELPNAAEPVPPAEPPIAVAPPPEIGGQDQPTSFAEPPVTPTSSGGDEQLTTEQLARQLDELLAQQAKQDPSEARQSPQPINRALPRETNRLSEPPPWQSWYTDPWLQFIDPSGSQILLSQSGVDVHTDSEGLTDTQVRRLMDIVAEKLSPVLRERDTLRLERDAARRDLDFVLRVFSGFAIIAGLLFLWLVNRVYGLKDERNEARGELRSARREVEVLERAREEQQEVHRRQSQLIERLMTQEDELGALRKIIEGQQSDLERYRGLVSKHFVAFSLAPDLRDTSGEERKEIYLPVFTDGGGTRWVVMPPTGGLIKMSPGNLLQHWRRNPAVREALKIEFIAGPAAVAPPADDKAM